ncbi:MULTISPECIES: SDR family NAD(P)-dependent oxidoreductase [Amycolatopsis]|uniref:SDR family oxidoreductase n=1 Tax=Amycolatopsis dendrobii TaxID=2760662 RepID=A0A7W3VXQ1_9PSEU|nr:MULTISPECIES: SDR family oxidoreductase [Amycolatopsis]MBB1154592.1 SDR family oxidoreductase [Amycolatopsis dendrobii]UKD56591.1 SDR family oxidoreductase [Amycolatopsis sp. FU40]
MRAALITGGASGIGAAAARRFAARGMRVVLVDRDEERGVAVAAEVDGRFVAADVGSLAGNERAVRAAVEEFGRVDVVLLNAGVPGRCGLADFTEESYRDTMRTNVDGVVYGLHACLPQLRGQGGGSVVVTASLAGLTGSPDLFYATSKYALVGLVRSAAPHLAADGVRINALCPGLVGTPIIAGFRPALEKAGLRIADPAEAAAAVETIAAGGGTGGAWVVQAGRPASLVPVPEIPLAG